VKNGESKSREDKHISENEGIKTINKDGEGTNNDGKESRAL